MNFKTYWNLLNYYSILWLGLMSCGIYADWIFLHNLTREFPVISAWILFLLFIYLFYLFERDIKLKEGDVWDGQI